jgi:patatin-like phospholipase/acyl hydrolase
MNVLSLEGGGMKGLYTCNVLKKIRIQDCEIIAGNSTGAIIAAALSIGYNPYEIIDFYLTDGTKLFQKNVRANLSLDGKLYPKYSASDLEKTLKKFFGDKKMKDCQTRFFCNAFNLTDDEPVYFKSWESEFQDLKLWEVVKASSSAPQYFASHNIAGKRYVDGGVESTCLALSVYIEAKLISGNRRVNATNIGTGNYKNTYKIGNEGGIAWLNNIINVFMSANGKSQKYILKKLIKRIKNNQDYFCEINKDLKFPIALDDVSEKAIRELLS